MKASESATTPAPPPTVAVFGDGPYTVEQIRALAPMAEMLVFLSMGAQATVVEAFPEARGHLIDVYQDYLEIERRAWDWATGLVTAVNAIPGVREQYSHLLKRGLFMGPLLEIASAHARWERVEEVLPPSSQVITVGLSSCQQSVATRRRAGVCHMETSNTSHSGDKFAGRLVNPRGLLGPLRNFVRTARMHYTSQVRLRRAIGLLQAEHRQREIHAAVFVGVPAHIRVLSSTLQALQQMGRVHVIVDMSRTGAFPAGIPFWDFYRPESIALQARRFFHTPRLQRLVRAWAASERLDEFAPMLTDWLATSYYVRVPALLAAHRRVLRLLGHKVALTVNETADEGQIEACAVAGHESGVPTVNVQHGVITSSKRRAEFDFDAFCVFGEGYAETLAEGGTRRETIRVVGNPLLDGVDGCADLEKRPLTATRAQLGVSSDAWVVLFAAQHRNDTLSDAILYESLATVLAGLRMIEGVELLVKWHPLGSGKEAGYLRALSEYTDVKVVSTRDTELYDLIVASDCVALLSSTVGFEAASFRRPTVVVSPDSSPDLLPFVKEGTALRATSVKEFVECIRVLRANPIPESAYRMMETRYHYLRDGGAGRRIAEICEELAGTRQHGSSED